MTTAQKRLARAASQTDPHSGVDPYNTADKLSFEQAGALDFQAWLATIPTVTGDDNANNQG